MNVKKVFFRLSIVVALSVWFFISLSTLQEVIESRKNTIAARSSVYIQEDEKATISTGQIIASEPSILVKIFGIFLIDVAFIWGLLWGCYCISSYSVSRLRHKIKTTQIKGKG